MTRFEDYSDRFRHVRLRREGGILELTIHSDGGAALWGSGPDDIHRELGDAFAAIAADPDTRVVIITGAGDVFCTTIDPGKNPPPFDAVFWDRIYREGMALIQNLLAIPVAVIAAVNGDAFVHAEIAVLSDIVLAAEGARFADKAHFPHGVVPGDGAHVVWPMLLGPNRGRYFLLTGEEIGADEARRLGFVAEVLSPDGLMPRAWALARTLAAKPEATLRHTRTLLLHDIKRRVASELGHGLMLEGMAMLTPRG